MFSEDSFIRRHKILAGLGVPIVLVVLFLGSRMAGHQRFYAVDLLNVGAGEQPGVLQVGVAKRDITPDLTLYDTYNDVDNDNKYRPKEGWMSHIKFVAGQDTYVDRNHNGKFDPVWIAGFGSNRPAKGVHDPLWARAIAFRNNGVTVAMVTLDAIGVFYDKFIDVRKSIDPGLKVDHVIFSSLHNHETPDTMGNWSGPIPTPPAYDHKNMQRIQKACKEAVEEAVRGLQSADMYIVPVTLDKPENFVDDSRKPVVIDKTVCCARFTKHGTDDTIATMVSWGNHPETLGGDNPLLTSDFCGYWRDGVENGVSDPSGAKGLGGMCLYFQGMVGGLMTQLHTTVPHRNGVESYREDSWEKAQALGDNLAIVTINGLRGPNVIKCENPRVGISAKTFYAPMSGLFKYAILLGLIHPGVYFTGDGICARSEVDCARVGDLEMTTVPGELYPEIAEGGVEAPAGQDFPIAPVEVPPLRQAMDGKVKMIIGLANDEIGYIVPKSQWDAKAPFAYGKEKGQYGEENSGGPGVAPAVHHNALDMIRRLQDAWPK